jgi:hypothetical protein
MIQDHTVITHTNPAAAPWPTQAVFAALMARVAALESGKQSLAEKDVRLGYAGLDKDAKVPAADLPFGADAGTVTEGNDPRLSDSRLATGAAGGDLAGAYPSPTVSGLSGTALPTHVGGGYLRRNADNTGWLETADVGTQSDLDEVNADLAEVQAALVEGSEAGLIEMDETVIEQWQERWDEEGVEVEV